MKQLKMLWARVWQWIDTFFVGYCQGFMVMWTAFGVIFMAFSALLKLGVVSEDGLLDWAENPKPTWTKWLVLAGAVLVACGIYVNASRDIDKIDAARTRRQMRILNKAA